jgi:DNA-binding MarR family transcriptional regulator
MRPDDTLDPTVKRGIRAFLTIISLTEPFTLDFWRAHELTLMQIRCLRILRERPLPAGDVARRLGLSPASMTRLLERLESRGYIRRTVDPEDRRRVLVALTEAGEHMTGTFSVWLDSPAVAAFKKLSPEDQERVADALERLAEQMRQDINP